MTKGFLTRGEGGGQEERDVAAFKNQGATVKKMITQLDRGVSETTRRIGALRNHGIHRQEGE
jgi:hypothetical protein